MPYVVFFMQSAMCEAVYLFLSDSIAAGSERNAEELEEFDEKNFLENIKSVSNQHASD